MFSPRHESVSKIKSQVSNLKDKEYKKSAISSQIIEKNIEDVKKGDSVVSFSLDGQISVEKVLEPLVHNTAKEYLHIEAGEAWLEI